MDLELIDVRMCPDCAAYFEESGPNGLVPHILTEHPNGELALRIKALLPPLLQRFATPRDKARGTCDGCGREGGNHHPSCVLLRGERRPL